ncbi:hypothetical protein Syun_009958 [Stephania yunnanensis]|uniref:Uncharacterized protein n=1 Tax=Stephania yunnanensis TaxID=152371 RepID=A0AAP0KHP9_9MAGN
MNVPAVDGGLLKPDVVEGTDDEVPYFVEIKRTIPKGSVQSKDFKTKKIFVGGVPTSCLSKTSSRTSSPSTGKWWNIEIIRDHNTNRSRGTPGLGGRLGGYGGYSGAVSLVGVMEALAASGLGAYQVMRFVLNLFCAKPVIEVRNLSIIHYILFSVDSTAYIASLITILTDMSIFEGKECCNGAMLASWKWLSFCMERSVSLSPCAEVSHCKGANVCVSPFALGTLSIPAYNEAKINTRRRNLIGFILFFISSTAVLVLPSACGSMYELLCVLLYAYVFGKLPIVKYYRAKAVSEGARTVVADLAAGGIQTEHAKGNKMGNIRMNHKRIRDGNKNSVSDSVANQKRKQRRNQKRNQKQNNPSLIPFLIRDGIRDGPFAFRL